MAVKLLVNQSINSMKTIIKISHGLFAKIITFLLVPKIPLGYEDKNGFHLGPEPSVMDYQI